MGLGGPSIPYCGSAKLCWRELVRLASETFNLTPCCILPSESGLAWFAPVCSSWVWVNRPDQRGTLFSIFPILWGSACDLKPARSTSQRSRDCALGNRGSATVRAATLGCRLRRGHLLHGRFVWSHKMLMARISGPFVADCNPFFGTLNFPRPM